MKRKILGSFGVVLTVTATVLLSQLYHTPSVQAVGQNFVVTSTNDSGVGSLRQAFIDANNNAGATTSSPHTITFNIAGTGVKTINLLSGLPTLNRPTTIDGTTQTGASCGTLVPNDASGAITDVGHSPHTL